MADIDNTQPVGTNPISSTASSPSFSVQFLGYQTSLHPEISFSHRDLGFTGSISGKWFALYGDALWCDCLNPGPPKSNTGPTCSFKGMVRNAVSACLLDEKYQGLKVQDLHLETQSQDDGKGTVPSCRQMQFVPFSKEWGEENTTGFGGTSIVETDGEKGEGAVYYLVNANERGLKGAGIAKIRLLGKDHDIPTVVQRFSTGHGYWWPSDKHPRYGDVATYRDVHSDYIYALGGSPTTVTDWPQNQYVYQTRVRASQAFELDKYEYWWGRQEGWKVNNPLDRFDKTTAVMWGVGQGQIVWSEWFGCYIFVYLEWSKVALRTAPKPEGPWSAGVVVYEPKLHGDFAYAGVAHPYLDPSGKTLTISYTNAPNVIEVIKVTFEK